MKYRFFSYFIHFQRMQIKYMNFISLFECTCAQQFSNRPFSFDGCFKKIFRKKFKKIFRIKSQINHFEDECNLGPFG